MYCLAGCSSIGRDSISPQIPTINPVDVEEMQEEQGNSGPPPVERILKVAAASWE